MMDWVARQAFAELWALAWHFGLMGFVLVCAVAWAWFMPVFKKTALWVALAAGVAVVMAGVYTKLGADYVQAKWDAAVEADSRDAEEARQGAERDVPPVLGDRIERLPDDPWDRANR